MRRSATRGQIPFFTRFGLPALLLPRAIRPARMLDIGWLGLNLPTRPWAAYLLASVLGLAAAPALATNFDVTVQSDDGSGGTSGTLSWAIQQANVDTTGTGPHTTRCAATSSSRPACAA